MNFFNVGNLQRQVGPRGFVKHKYQLRRLGRVVDRGHAHNSRSDDLSPSQRFRPAAEAARRFRLVRVHCDDHLRLAGSIFRLRHGRGSQLPHLCLTIAATRTCTRNAIRFHTSLHPTASLVFLEHFARQARFVIAADSQSAENPSLRH